MLLRVQINYILTERVVGPGPEPLGRTMFEGLGLLRARLIHNFPLWQLYLWPKVIWNMRHFEFPTFFCIFLWNRENGSHPTFGERFGIRLLWRQSDRYWPFKRAMVSNRRLQSDLDGSPDSGRHFQWNDLRNCELNFNFRVKSCGIENHTCFFPYWRAQLVTECHKWFHALLFQWPGSQQTISRLYVRRFVR